MQHREHHPFPMRNTYANPVFERNFPDPSVLKYRGEYWAYGTGRWSDGRWFGVLRSRDLAAWEAVGGAMDPLPGDWPCVWAPEVSYYGGRFYLYYSVGDEETMQIRVAVAEHPAGPFVDSGRRLTREPFAIDAHVFTDDDGARYLFYATDYLEHTHIGTGTARDRLLDPLTLEGRPVPVTRAGYAWQIYDPRRASKGGVCWHTLEGPFVLKRKGRYYQMFSGGNWQNVSYGVSYAVAERPDGAEEWSQVADGERVRPILRTVPGLVIGPGHNSAVRGPDNLQLYCVYHRWSDDMERRMLAIDPLDWAGERMLVRGPSTTPRPLALPTLADFFERGELAPHWEARGGRWRARGGAAVQDEPADAAAALRDTPPAYIAEVSVQALAPQGSGAYGIALGADARVLIEPGAGRAVAQRRAGGQWSGEALPLPADFAPGAFHLLRAEVGHGRALVQLDEGPLRWELPLSPGPAALALVTAGAPAAFAGFALTEGWRDLFAADGAPEALGWLPMGGAGGTAGWRIDGLDGWRVAGGALHAPRGGVAPVLCKGPLPPSYELTVNVALGEGGQGYAIYPAAGPGAPGLALTLRRDGDDWALAWGTTRLTFEAGFDPRHTHQLQVRVARGHIQVAHEGAELGELPAQAGGAYVGLGGDGASFEMVTVRRLG